MDAGTESRPWAAIRCFFSSAGVRRRFRLLASYLAWFCVSCEGSSGLPSGRLRRPGGSSKSPLFANHLVLGSPREKIMLARGVVRDWLSLQTSIMEEGGDPETLNSHNGGEAVRRMVFCGFLFCIFFKSIILLLFRSGSISRTGGHSYTI